MEGTTQTPSTTKPFLSHISGSKTKLASLPHYIDLFDESVCQSPEENSYHLDELKSLPSKFFQSSSKPFELPQPPKTSISNQPWEGFCLRTKKITIEDPKKVKVVYPNPHSTICNSEPKPSLFWIHLILNPSLITLLTFVLHLIWISLISVIPPAPLPM